ncbi:anthranilate synthase component II [Fusobacterium sp. MFO224]|uniref:anthranilate synthase component II n=1 Tax=Fusobacterium sp. MFO224 TaxID=3378070 RepID=UPI003851D392
MILIIDNYDSFTYNLVQYLKILNKKILVKRNDEITLKEIEKLDLEGILLSPGPGNPKTAGITLKVIDKFKGEIPIIGICLGHQSIAEAFGGRVIKGKEPVHGKISEINHKCQGVFKGLKSPLNVTRYHSLIVEESSLPKDFIVTAKTKDNIIMGIRHKKYLIEGIQFHPEALLTECGLEMLDNFFKEAHNFGNKGI